jgi:ABC-2 type transport system ATP-binding protein
MLSAESQHMLKVQELTYRYSSQVILSDATLSLKAGKLAVLVGQNGAGKSTLLRCLAGWTQAEAGTITVNNISLRDDEQAFRHQVMFIPDTPDFYDTLTAQEHLQFVAQLHQVDDWQSTAEKLLNSFDLSAQRDAFPFTFSRGMRYKLAVCMALLVRPPLLLLDEPFGPLDALAGQVLWQHLCDYPSDYHSVLFSSHTLPDASQPDNIFHLYSGSIQTLQPSDDMDLARILHHAE